MDFDLEILSEDDDRPDPLFDSIMSAMNSMKEATADKIYQKIQKEGATNYSKPQVDRALANALKYGIFEVRNNRYRVRDDILDDEDTVYWKLQKKRTHTPFRIPETTGRQSGLDPETDKQRFRRPRKNNNSECPHCGRAKRPAIEENSRKGRRVRKIPAKRRKTFKKEKTKKSNSTSEHVTRRTRKRKVRLDLHRDGRSSKRRKPNGPKDNDLQIPTNDCSQGCYSDEDFLKDLTAETNLLQEACNISESDMDLLLASDHSIKSNSGENTDFNAKNREPPNELMPESISEDVKIVKAKRSSISLKSESDSEKTRATSASDDLSQSRTADGFFDGHISRNPSDKARNEYVSSGEMHDRRDQTGQNKGDSDWLGCSEEPQSTIIESNNVLTIKPIDSLAFKSPEQATYIS